MRARILFFMAAILAPVPVARAQVGASGSGPVQLAQFQSGITPRASRFDLDAGQSVRLALNCIDLFAGTPTDQVAFTAPGSEATVTVADDQELALGDAISRGLLAARGRGPHDPGPSIAGAGYEVVLANLSPLPLQVAMPAGTLLVPAGQPVPDLLPGVRRLLGVAAARGLLGSRLLAEAVWATRGSTREDVEETMLAALPDAEARNVQELLQAANLGYDFAGQDHGEYARRYDQQRARLLNPAAPVSGWAVLPDGRRFRTSVVAEPAGRAVATLTPLKGGRPLYYAARVVSRRPDRLVLQLLNLKTRQPLELARAPLSVRLAGG